MVPSNGIVFRRRPTIVSVMKQMAVFKLNAAFPQQVTDSLIFIVAPGTSRHIGGYVLWTH